MTTRPATIEEIIEYSSLDEVKFAVEKYGYDIRDRNECALRRACYLGRLEVVKYLVEQGADYTNKEAMTSALYMDHTEVVEYLTYCKSLYYKMKMRRK